MHKLNLSMHKLVNTARPRINRRDFIKACMGGASAFITGNLFAKQTLVNKNRRPNIILFVSDDHGLDAVGCYGNTIIQTPNLDCLAADGVRFTYAFCTTASCSPSRSVILTGLYSHATGQYGLQHSYHHFISFDRIKSLPVLLSQAGYRTARIGKYHVAPTQVYKFETVLSANSRNPVEMAEKCRDFITDDNRPFFLYFCPVDPHRSGDKAEELPYKPNRFGNRPQRYPGVKTIKYDPKEVIVPSFLPSIPQCRAELAQYYQSVSRLDQGLGRLLDILKEAGKYDDTLIIYISDNGIAFPGAKTTLYEPGIRLPCIIRAPGLKRRGIVCNAMITWADIAPTILDFADALPKDITFHGRSFKSIIEQENPKGWDEIYASHTFHEVTMYYPMRAVRQRKYKLIWNIAYGLPFPFASDLWNSSTWQAVQKLGYQHYGKRSIKDYLYRPEFELYDLENDPYEVKNLANDPKYANILSQLKMKLKAFQERTKDPWVIKWQYK